MRLTFRIGLLYLFLAALLPAQTPGAPAKSAGRILLDASRALQAGNAALFLSYFDAAQFEDYPRLESNVVALTQQADIASSVEITVVAEEGGVQRLTADWLLQLTPSSGFGPAAQRREEVTVRFRDVRGKSKVVSLAPVDLFRPL